MLPTEVDPVPRRSSAVVVSALALPAVVGNGTIRRIRLIGEAIFSTEDGPPPLDRLDWLTSETEDFLTRSGSRARWMFSFLVFVTALLAPWCIGRFTTLARLSRDERIAALATLERRFGEPLLAVKAILCLIYYEHPDAAREVGAGDAYQPRIDEDLE